MAVLIDMEFGQLLHNISFKCFISDQCAGAHYILWKFPNFASASNMIMSWHGNAFPIIGHLWWGSTGHWWIPLTKSHVFWATYWMNGQLLSFQSEICLGYVARKGQNDNKNELYMTKNNVAFQTKLYSDHEYNINFSEINIGIVANPCFHFMRWYLDIIILQHDICPMTACYLSYCSMQYCHITACYLSYYKMFFVILQHVICHIISQPVILQQVIFIITACYFALKDNDFVQIRNILLCPFFWRTTKFLNTFSIADI